MATATAASTQLAVKIAATCHGMPGAGAPGAPGGCANAELADSSTTTAARHHNETGGNEAIGLIVVQGLKLERDS